MLTVHKRTWLQLSEEDRLAQIMDLLNVKEWSPDVLIINNIWVDFRNKLPFLMLLSKVMTHQTQDEAMVLAAVQELAMQAGLKLCAILNEEGVSMQLIKPIIAIKESHYINLDVGSKVKIGSIVLIEASGKEKVTIDLTSSTSKPLFGTSLALQYVKFLNSLRQKNNTTILQMAPPQIGSFVGYNIILYQPSHLVRINITSEKMRTSWNNKPSYIDTEFVDDEYDDNVSLTEDLTIAIQYQRIISLPEITLNIPAYLFDEFRHKIIYDAEVTFSTIYSIYYKQKFGDAGLERLNNLIPLLKLCSLIAILIDRKKYYTINKIEELSSTTNPYLTFFNKVVKKEFAQEMRMGKQILGLSSINNLVSYILSKALKLNRQHKIEITYVSPDRSQIYLSLNDQCGFQQKYYATKTRLQVDTSHRWFFYLTSWLNKLKNSSIKNIKSPSIRFNIMLKERKRFNIEDNKPIVLRQEAFLKKYNYNTLDNLLSKLNLPERKGDFVRNNAQQIGILSDKRDEEISNANDLQKHKINSTYLNYAIDFIKIKIRELSMKYRFKIPEIFNEDLKSIISIPDLTSYKSIQNILWSFLIKLLETKKITGDECIELISSMVAETKRRDITNKSIDHQEMFEEQLRSERLAIYLSMTPEEKLETGIDSMNYTERNAFLDELIAKRDMDNVMYETLA